MDSLTETSVFGSFRSGVVLCRPQEEKAEAPTAGPRMTDDPNLLPYRGFGGCFAAGARVGQGHGISHPGGLSSTP